MTKREVFELLLKDSEARVSLDARVAGVVVPERFKNLPNLGLDYSYNFQPPITDITLTDEGIAATLSFAGKGFLTFVPWAAIFAIADFKGRGMFWAQDVPQEVIDKTKAPTPRTEPLPPKQEFFKNGKPKPSHLKLVN